MIGQFLTINLATLHWKTIIPVTTRQPVAPDDPESAVGLRYKAQAVEGRIASPSERAPESIKPAAGAIGLDPIVELERYAVRGGQGLAEQR